MNQNCKRIIDYSIIVLLAMGAALNYRIFIFENTFAPAGINGIATMIQYVFDIQLGYLSLVINIPLAIAAFFSLKRAYTLRTTAYIIVFSVALILFDRIDLSAFVYFTENGTSKVLAPIAAGTINGAIYACLLRMNASTGGTDIIAGLIRQKKPYFDLVWIIFVLNVIVAGISYFVYDYRIEPVICCVLYCFATSRISDGMLKGGKQAIKFEIITPVAEEISADIIRELRHSVTALPATGMYTHSEKQMIVCVINKHQIADFHNIIRRYPDTFAYISSVSETVGNFKKISAK